MSEQRPWIADLGTEVPVHERAITISVYDTETTFELDGRLTDRRPWADGVSAPSDLHTMSLRLEVDRGTMTITRAEAKMLDYPHMECPGIAPAFAQLVGLSITRGFTKAVQERFGRERGCSHLEFLARCLGPAVIQAIPSSALRREPPATAGSTVLDNTTWLENTCHFWATGGIGATKLAIGWRPGGKYPAPSLEELQATLGSAPEIDDGVDH